MQGNRTKPTTSTPNTLMVGVYVEDNIAAITASLRSSNGQLRSDIYEATGETYQALADALYELHKVAAQNLLILTTDDNLHRRLRRPFQYDDGDPQQWPAAYWHTLDRCTIYCRMGSWHCVQVNDLPKGRKLWQERPRPRAATK